MLARAEANLDAIGADASTRELPLLQSARKHLAEVKVALAELQAPDRRSGGMPPDSSRVADALSRLQRIVHQLNARANALAVGATADDVHDMGAEQGGRAREAEDADADMVEADPEVRAALVRAGRNLEALDAAVAALPLDATARNEATAAAVEGVRALLDDLRSKPELIKRAPRLQELLRRTRARLARLEDADAEEALRSLMSCFNRFRHLASGHAEDAVLLAVLRSAQRDVGRAQRRARGGAVAWRFFANPADVHAAVGTQGEVTPHAQEDSVRWPGWS